MKSTKVSLFFLLGVFAVGCTTKIPVLVTDNEYPVGGSFHEVRVVTSGLTIKDNAVYGMPGPGGGATTAVVYENAKGEQAVNYSNMNRVVYSYKAKEKKKNEKYQKLSISRKFEDDVSTIPLYKDDDGNLVTTTSSSASSIVSSIKKGGSFYYNIFVINSGNMKISKPFLVADSLPSFIEVKKITATWLNVSTSLYSTGDIQKLTYNKIKQGERVNLAFKAYPGKKGFNPTEMLKIKVKCTLDKNKI